MAASIFAVVLAVSVCAPPSVRGQGVVIDEGRFRVRISGRDSGTEEFTIRRAGTGRDEAVFANGSVTLGASESRQEVSALLRANPTQGTTVGYQVTVGGRDSLDFQMTLTGRRYVALTRSTLGQEEREFAARSTTRVIEQSIAHHYYFLRDLREGERVHVIEPRSGRQATLTVTRRSDDEIVLENRRTPAVRLELQLGDQSRVVWYDRLGRVLRVEIPALGYVAERVDLVG